MGSFGRKSAEMELAEILARNPEIQVLQGIETNPITVNFEIDGSVKEFEARLLEDVEDIINAPNLSESRVQTIYFNWVRECEDHDPRYKMIYHVPNGGKRDGRTARSFKGEGLRPGMWDINIEESCRGFHGARFEAKRPAVKPKSTRAKKGGLSDLQIEHGHRLINRGYFTGVGYTADELKILTKWYFGEIDSLEGSGIWVWNERRFY